MELQEKKLALIEQLEKEQIRLDKLGRDTYDHTLTIRYLKTGIFSDGDLAANDLLDAAVNDFDCLYGDYYL